MAEIVYNEFNEKLDHVLSRKALSNADQFEGSLKSLLVEGIYNLITIKDIEQNDDNLNIKEKIFYSLAEFYAE